MGAVVTDRTPAYNKNTDYSPPPSKKQQPTSAIAIFIISKENKETKADTHTVCKQSY